MLGEERPKSITLIERLLVGKAKSRGLHFCCEGWGKLHLDMMQPGRVAGLASGPLQKGCGPADGRVSLSHATIPWRSGSSS